MCDIPREEVYRDIEAKLGLVPEFIRQLPDSTLLLEWELFQRVQLDPGAIPNKYRELIGLGIAAISKCRYCALFHTEAARLFGATDAEIEEAVHYAKSAAGWSAYLNGLQVDYDRFRQEVRKICDYVHQQQAAPAA
jgi:AhpD family alkylhydroperoxidase